MAVSVTASGSTRGLVAPLARLVRMTLARESARVGGIAIVLADDAVLRELNRRYRGVDRATDVLSFAYEDATLTPALSLGARSSRGRRVVSGDLVISRQRVRAQARRYRVSAARELARLVVHGALHLAGLDHHRAAERAHMRAREEKALAESKAVIASLERILAAGD